MRIKSWRDNTGTESASNRLYTGKYPLNIFVQRLSLFSCFSGIRLDVGHIPGEHNVDADLLSRWDGQADSLPDQFEDWLRIPLTLQQLWFRDRAVELHPSSASLPWRPPVNDFFM